MTNIKDYFVFWKIKYFMNSKSKLNNSKIGCQMTTCNKNIINKNKFEIKTPDVSIKVSPDRSDLIETRVIGGVKYILICADENVEVNGVNIHIKDGQ